MQIRSAQISNSILEATSVTPCPNLKTQSLAKRLVKYLWAFFSLFSLPLSRYRIDDFASLRQDVWQLDSEAYSASFRLPRKKQSLKPKDGEDDMKLIPVGDLGYSGSTFFTTSNSKYLIKSLPRQFEHSFFIHDLFDPYVEHMRQNPQSLLVRITDMVYTEIATLGGIVGAAPTHHIIMENLLYGQERDAARDKWETYDLKPSNFFFPERDISDGKLAPDSVKQRLLDEFADKMRITPEQNKMLVGVLEKDTRFLAKNNAVDYSLFLVRYPGPNSEMGRREIPHLTSNCNYWRTGVDDVNGEWTYRVVVLDFFWAKHKLHAQAMTGLVGAFNLVASKGPMSITAEPGDYRERFMNMVRDMTVDS